MKTGDSDFRRQRPEALMASLPFALATSLKKRGFYKADIATRWEDVAGSWIAAHSRPVKISFPAGKRVGGCLHLVVDQTIAPVLQHAKDQLLDRVNSFFGWAAVDKIRFYQHL